MSVNERQKTALATNFFLLKYGVHTIMRTVSACLHNPSHSGMDYMILDVQLDVNACDCIQGSTDTARESALKVNSGRKIPCRPGESNLCQRRASPMLYHLIKSHPRDVEIQELTNLNSHLSLVMPAFMSVLSFALVPCNFPWT